MSKNRVESIKKSELYHYIMRYSLGTLKEKQLLKKDVYALENLTEFEKDELWRLIVRLGEASL